MRSGIFCLAVLLLLAGCTRQGADAPAGGRSSVVWISIDGFRHDYLDRFEPPFLTRLGREGGVSRALLPVFPSSTFPSHVAQACGVGVGGHGIPNNSFFDRETGQRYSHPDDSALLRAEPIWITATRQGVRVVNTDWPVSQKPSGPWRVAYAPPSFDNRRSDQARLDETIDVLRRDSGGEPIRLVMSYVGQLDAAGHRHGPDAAETAQTLRRVDEMLQDFHGKLLAWFDSTHGPRDELFLLITTDHGMETVHTRVNPERLVGAELLRGVRISRGATLIMLYLDALPAAQQAGRAREIVAKLKDVPYVRAWTAADVPKHLAFADRSRVGDVMISLAPGYTFGDLRQAVTMPLVGGNSGAHGYDPAESPNMAGVAILWRYRKPLAGLDLGEIHGTQCHAWVAELLGIKPAAGTAAAPKFTR